MLLEEVGHLGRGVEAVGALGESVALVFGESEVIEPPCSRATRDER